MSGAATRHGGAVAAAVTAAVLLTGCQGDTPGRSGGTGGTGGTGTGGTTTGPRGTATSPAPSYDAEQRALVRQAQRELEEFELRSQRFLSAGRLTAQAQRFYGRRLRDPEPVLTQLRRYEEEGIRIARRPVVLSTRAVSVQVFQDDAVDVVLERCVDRSDLGMTKDGTPVPTGPDEPVVQALTVYRFENRTWRIGNPETTDEPCAR